MPDVLAETFKETPTPYASLESIVQELSSGREYLRLREIEEFKSLAVPRLGQVEYFCAMRTRFDKKFIYLEDDIENYKPNVVDNHPVVVVNVNLYGSSKNLTFQMDQERLDRLISELIAAQRQLKILVDGWPASNGKQLHDE